jgi:hypothetical protein
VRKGGRIMFRSRWLIIVTAAVLAFTMVVDEQTVFGEQSDSMILRKAKKLKRALRLELTPHRQVIGILRTGQTRSYAAGDDGDFERGVSWPDPRFVDEGDGTVIDRVTGLMWTKNAQKILGTMNWHDALKACNDLVFAGYDNWRLPNVREILSLIDYGMDNPALPDGQPFDDVQTSHLHWSSTTCVPHTAQAWCVGLKNGAVGRYNKASNAYFVWPVRRGRQRTW